MSFLGEQYLESSLLNVGDECVVQAVDIIVFAFAVLVFGRKLVELRTIVSVGFRIKHPQLMRKNVKISEDTVELVGGRPPTLAVKVGGKAVVVELATYFTIDFYKYLTTKTLRPFLQLVVHYGFVCVIC